jgi:hypothetical protein
MDKMYITIKDGCFKLWYSVPNKNNFAPNTRCYEIDDYIPAYKLLYILYSIDDFIELW